LGSKTEKNPEEERNVFARRTAACVDDSGYVQVMEGSTVVVKDRKELTPNAIQLSRFPLANTITDRARILALRWPIANQTEWEILFSFRTRGHAYGDRNVSSSGMNRRRLKCRETTSTLDCRMSVNRPQGWMAN